MSAIKTAVGLHAFGGSLALAAEGVGIKVLALLDARGGKRIRSNNIFARTCERVFGVERVFVDGERRWDDPLASLREQKIDILFGQPQFSGSKGMHRAAKASDAGFEIGSLLGEDGDDFVRIANDLRPRAVVIFGTGMLYSRGQRHLNLLASQLSEYTWKTMTTNAVLHGVAQDRKITVAIGTRDFFFNPTIPYPQGIRSDELPTSWAAIADLFDLKCSFDGRYATIMALEGREIEGHIVPQKMKQRAKSSLASDLLWGSCSLLAEGQALSEVEDLSKWPEGIRRRINEGSIVIEKDARGHLLLRKGLLKSQLPVRLLRGLPAPTIGSVERYIHPAHDRPLTLREVARLFGLPDDYYVGNYYLPGLRVLGSSVPVPVGKWVLSDLCRSMDEPVPASPPDISLLFDQTAVPAVSQAKRDLLGKWVDKYTKPA